MIAREEPSTALLETVDALGRLVDGDGNVRSGYAFTKRHAVLLARARHLICSDRRNEFLRDALRMEETPGNRAGQLPWYMTTLRDGSVGYFQRRNDDCLQAAIASCAGLSPHLLSDLRLREQLQTSGDQDEVSRSAYEKLAHWQHNTGTLIRFHPTPPRAARRWIGVIRREGLFSDHCLVMAGRECLFDPSGAGFDDLTSPRYDPADIDYGITIE